jgi:UPF0755 protein
MRKFFTFMCAALLLTTIIASLLFFKFINVPAETTGSKNDKSQVFDVLPGTSFAAVSDRLAEAGLISDRNFFYWYGRLMRYSGKIQVGEYEIRPSYTPRKILETLSTGKSIAYPITIPEGYNMFEIASVLDQRWPGRGQEFLKYIRDPKVTERLLGEALPSLEGYLFPNTYSITKYTTVKQIAEMMVDQFNQEYKVALEGSTKNLTRHQAVTLASMIEKETGVPEERPMIASVFHNRLTKGMRLQSDPTIIYGYWVENGKALENIKKSDILKPTPYNTYTVAALPVGPIANPGREALKAALKPEASEFYFFVSRNDGTHIFTKEYQEHQKAVQKFQLDSSAREGKSWRNLKKAAN